MRWKFFFVFILIRAVAAQQAVVPQYYSFDSELSTELHNLAGQAGLLDTFSVGDDGSEQISLAVIDLSSRQPSIGGVHYENFIYPASVYKMYVAAAVLAKASVGKIHLRDSYIVPSHNAVDSRREISFDPRPVLQQGDTVTIQYLLDLMITRSDNSAANCLIDIAERNFINTMMHENGWYGSEVTRKFLKRKFEDPGYDTIRGTETCALHAADFMYKIQTGCLINHWVSAKMKILLGAQLDAGKLNAGLPEGAVFYHKTGWFSYWTNDVGIVEDAETRYIIACFIPLPEEQALPKMQQLAAAVHALMKQRIKNTAR